MPLGSGVAAPLAAEAARRARRPLNILIIEDIEDSAWTLRDLLELEGHEVRIATDGGNGIELAIVVRPDVIVCDLGLPGIDGYEVAKRLRAAKMADTILAFRNRLRRLPRFSRDPPTCMLPTRDAFMRRLCA